MISFDFHSLPEGCFHKLPQRFIYKTLDSIHKQVKDDDNLLMMLSYINSTHRLSFFSYSKQSLKGYYSNHNYYNRYTKFPSLDHYNLMDIYSLTRTLNLLFTFFLHKWF